MSWFTYATDQVLAISREALRQARSRLAAGANGYDLKRMLKGRVRFHHVYYLVAAFDVAAVIAGLMLTHVAVGALSTTVRSNMDWSDIHDQITALRAAVGRANAPGNDVFASRDAASELLRLNSAAAEFGPALSSVQHAIARKIPQQARQDLDGQIAKVDASMNEMLDVTRLLLQKFADGQVDAASADMASMDQRYSDVLAAIDASGRQLRGLESTAARNILREAHEYRNLEVGLVFMIILMVIFVTVYGQRVGALLEQQAAELAKFNAELEKRVEERTAELAASQAETARQREELRQRNEHFDIALNNMNRGLCLYNSEQRIVVANDRYFDIYGLDPKEHQPGTSLETLLSKRANKGGYSGNSPEDYRAARLATVAAGEVSVEVHSLSDGRVVEVGHYPTADGGWVSTHDDITDRRRMEQQIVHLAHHDVLTGLPNRRKLREELEAAIRRNERGAGFALLCLDLDHFKQVNDTLGHPIGDRLLQSVADRLRRVVRKGDIVARLGGDEFAIIQALAGHTGEPHALADRVIADISQPYEIDGHQIVIGTSVGIALSPSDGADANTLLKNADLALYRAKSEGKGVHRSFEPEMDARGKARRQLELDLRKAVALGEFELFYQPLIEARSGDVAGFEALIRWRHKERGTVSPADFIPLAEEIGLMGEIGAWVLRQACKEAITWPSHCRVAVNISPAQFRSRQLDFDVMTAIAASGLPPHRLELEITESVLLEHTEATMSVLHRLRDFGVKIAMDDFGTGYSSLSYLHTFPFDKIKIDRSFTQSAGSSSSSLAIIQAVLGLGKSLGMSTTAEGVETTDQLRRLRDEGCVELQGYLFSRPVPAGEIPRLLDSLTTNACHAIRAGQTS